MSSDPQIPFLERRAYRQRRLVDAARMLPIFGAILLCLPMLWSLKQDGVVATTYVIRFLFLSWLGLIILAAVVSARLPRPADKPDPSGVSDSQDS